MTDGKRGPARWLRDRSGRLRGLLDPGAAGDGPVARHDLRQRGFGQVMVAIWLVFLLEPLHTAWSLSDRVRGWAGIVVLIAFAVAYLRHFYNSGVRAFAPHVELCAARRRMVWPGYLIVFALAVLATVLIGQDGTTTWVFLGVSGLWTWRIWQSWVVGLLLAAAYVGLEYQLPGWSSDNSLLFALMLAMLAASGGVVAARRGHALSEAQEENARMMVQEERNRMARDLHDILGHSLTVITVKAELAGRLMDVDPERARVEVADLERLSRTALGDVRRAVEGYREISLSGELARAREALASGGIRADLPTALDEVPADLHEIYAWTVRETVTNIIRHSGATSCEVAMGSHGITVTDDGHGSAAMGMNGNGLRGLRERAVAAGAQLITRSIDPHGFQVTVAVADEPADADPVRETAVRRSGEALA